MKPWEKRDKFKFTIAIIILLFITVIWLGIVDALKINLFILGVWIRIWIISKILDYFGLKLFPDVGG